MAMQGGFGLDLQINSGSLTTIANLFDAEFPAQEAILVDATCHDETSGYKVWMASGLKTLSAFTATIGWDISEAEHAQILTSLGNDASVGMAIADPSADETIAFSAFVQSVKRVSSAEDVYKCEVTFQPTGGPTIT